MKLFAALYGARPNKILITAEYLGLELTQEVVTMEQLKTPEFLEMHPLGKVPVLQTAEGCIFESNAIVRYLTRLRPEQKLYGATPYEGGLIDQWLDFTSTEIEPHIYQILPAIFGWGEVNPERRNIAIIEFSDILAALENRIGTRKFLVGDQLTIADIVVSSTLADIFRVFLDTERRKKIPNITRWFEGVSAHENFVRVWGKVRLCQQEFPIFRRDGHDQKAGAKKQAEQPKKAQPEPAKKAQPEKKEAAPKKAADEDEGDAGEKKEKNPLDALPPSNFPLYDFKTLFVNAENKQEALDYLWKNFDPNGFSLWFVQYQKAEGEGAKLFLTNNLMNGFLQRLEHFRKYAFGVHGVYGEEPNLEIRGVWLWRGTVEPKEIKELDSYEYHTWTKLDSSNENDRKKVEEYWKGLKEDTIVDGLRARTVQYFK